MKEFMKLVGQLLFNNNITNETEPAIIKVLQLIPDSYVLIGWPEVQDLMEEDWFRKEAVLDNSENAESSTYFIPIKRLVSNI